jgi:hypothetical protein
VTANRPPEAGTCVPFNRLLARSDRGAIFLHGAVVGPGTDWIGPRLLVTVAWRDPELYLEHLNPMWPGAPAGQPRLGVRLAGGELQQVSLMPTGLPCGLRQDFEVPLGTQTRVEGTMEIVCDWTDVGIHSSALVVEWPEPA